MDELMKASNGRSILRRNVITGHCENEVVVPGRLVGEYWVTRIDRASGKVLGHELLAKNAVTANGRTAFLEMGAGLGSHQNFARTRSRLRIRDSSDAIVFSANQADTGYPQLSANGLTATWRWSDISINTYTVQSAELSNTTSSLVFSSGNVSLSGGNSKPASENWLYTYTLTLSGGFQFNINRPPGGSASMPDDWDGLAVWMRRFVGAAGSDVWGEGIEATIYQLSGTTVQDQSTIVSTAGPTRSGNELMWEFVAATNQANHRWDWIDVHYGLLILQRAVEEAGEKSEFSEWIWRYRFILN